jgi:hypothetical protein
MKILKKGGVGEKRGEEETKSMPHAPVIRAYVVLFYYVPNQNKVFLSYLILIISYLHKQFTHAN